MTRTPDYVANLRAVYSRASRLDVAEGKLWYPEARGELYDIAKRYRFSLKRVAYAAAALSNNMPWDRNIALVEHVAYVVRNGLQARGHYARLLDKAVSILRDGLFTALSGPKVEPFARALYGDTRAVVVDRWMFRAAWGEHSPSLTFKRHREVAVSLRVLAREVRRPVSEVQAVIWTRIQREWNDAV